MTGLITRAVHLREPRVCTLVHTNTIIVLFPDLSIISALFLPWKKAVLQIAQICVDVIITM